MLSTTIIGTVLNIFISKLISESCLFSSRKTKLLENINTPKQITKIKSEKGINIYLNNFFNSSLFLDISQICG